MNGPDTRDKRGFVGWLRSVPANIWVALVIAAIALIFVLQNRQKATIELFNISMSAPLWMTLLVTLLIGLVIGLLIRRNRRTGQRPR
ncbi:hypothetical protein BLA60_37205 [Actinophytocola xinjiangensis]|uniref:Integral membrane protein n=1 Tax=Actinophytocola xinjiangensis TaxID=485602 RepID=A0A7Z0WGZ9_9PSEU|nr:lipopolysaccharide assembly protein LapA domain-containing protein [Actinophytocola xinjiangensis]OLF05161.1 hypothetical protein BLA60_37205 [Actinophytocola xinjiangensis]